MKALDPVVMLATGMHGQPGVYALLIGSGVSTGAGIPTGWGVVTELVPGQATFALLMVSARRMTLRRLGSVACRFRQAM